MFYRPDGRVALQLFDAQNVMHPDQTFTLPAGYELDMDVADATALENKLSDHKTIKALGVNATKSWSDKAQFRLKTRNVYGRRENHIIAVIGPPGAGKTYIGLTIAARLCEWYRKYGVWDEFGWPVEEQCFSLKRNFVQDYLDFIKRKEFYLKPANIVLFDDNPEYREEDKKPYVRQAVGAAEEATRRLRGQMTNFIFMNTDQKLIPKDTIKELYIPIAINPGKQCMALLYRNKGGDLVPAGRMLFDHPKDTIKRPFSELDGPELLDVLEGKGDAGEKGAMMRRISGAETRRPGAEQLLETLRAAHPDVVKLHIGSGKARYTFLRSRMEHKFEAGPIDGAVGLWRELLQTTGCIRMDGKTDLVLMEKQFPLKYGLMLRMLELLISGRTMDQALAEAMAAPGGAAVLEKKEEPRKVAPAEEPRRVASDKELEGML